MTSDPFSSHELKLLRQFLFFTQAEAADIAGLSVRQWKRMEIGDSPVSDAVTLMMLDISLWRNNLICGWERKYKQSNGETEADDRANATVIAYDSADEFAQATGHDAMYYKPYLSACAQMLSAGWAVETK